MEKRITKDEYYLGVALAVAKRSTCLKRHYGCIIVKNGEIIAPGYNGSPRGEVNCCDKNYCGRLDKPHNSGDYSDCHSVHAEQNALIVANYNRLVGATVYLACEGFIDKYGVWDEDDNPIPCPICLRMLKNAGISKVINRRGEVKCL